ncbi:hypothetical protein SCA6_020590 [Theobroma cacao]
MSGHLSKLPALIRRFAHFNFLFSAHPIRHHTDIFVTKPASYTRECNMRINDFGRRGKVKAAKQLFDEMLQSHRDAASYASMITVYLKNNHLPKAEALFTSMPRTHRNIVAESAMIHGYVKAGRLPEARKLFDDMVDRNVFSWTSLISGYFAVGQVAEGRLLFEQMPMSVKNVVSWTTVVLGYAHNGLIDEARHVFDRMPDKNIVAWTAMLKSYVDNGRIDDAIRLFYQMPQRNLYAWNIMISACLKVSRVCLAIQLFDSLPHKNLISWTSMVSGLARNGMTKQAREYFDQMPVSKDIAAWNAMITAYVDQGDMPKASELFYSMPNKNIVAWNVMIDGYSRNGAQGEAFSLLILMLRSGFRPNETTITSVLTSCNSILEVGQAHALAFRLGFDFEHGISLTKTLLSAYSRIGDLNSARLAFQGLKAKDLVSWTAMILAYSHHGYGKHALHVFAAMLTSGAKPDEITFVGVLSACSHAGFVEKGQRLFDSMSHMYGLQPRAEHYSCLVDILGRAGQVEKAMSVVNKMPPSECDGAVLGALLAACRLHRDDKIANHIGKQLIELEPTDSGGYVLLANVYAAQEKWNEFARVRKMMKERKVKKVAGFSYVEVKGKNHVFFVGDRCHPQVEEMYEMLRVMLPPRTSGVDCIQGDPTIPLS